MRPEPTLHFSLPLFVLHVSPSLPAILRECPFRKVKSNRSFDAWLLKHMLAHERGPAFAKISLMAGIELILRWVRWIVVVWSATRKLVLSEVRCPPISDTISGRAIGRSNCVPGLPER